MLISNKPKVIEFELERNAYWTKEVGDTFRPTSKLEAGNTDNSIYCYLEALEGAYTHFAKKSPDFDFFNDFQSHIYHVPFCGMVFRAHRTQLRRLRPVGRQEFQDHFDQKVARSLSYNTRFGGTYSAATFLALMGTIDHTDHLKGGDRLSIFSYGSGSCAEFYSAIVCPEAKEVVGKANLGQLLDNRKIITVAEYEAVESERTDYIDLPTYTPPLDAVDGLYESNYAGRNLLIFKEINGFFREYVWS
jgi:hydroxymethylglutaryl-CoA synthase